MSCIAIAEIPGMLRMPGINEPLGYVLGTFMGGVRSFGPENYRAQILTPEYCLTNCGDSYISDDDCIIAFAPFLSSFLTAYQLRHGAFPVTRETTCIYVKPAISADTALLRSDMARLGGHVRGLQIDDLDIVTVLLRHLILAAHNRAPDIAAYFKQELMRVLASDARVFTL